MKTWLLRLVKVLVVTELIYLILINVALNLPVTQTVVNRIKPDKFTVTWTSAWSFYPFSVHARNIFTNGQSGSQQWQAQAPVARASISLVSLLWRTVQLSGIKAQDVKYYQRPRPKPDKDYSDTRTYFPPIEGRPLEVEPVAVQLPPKGIEPWHINIDDIQIDGRHELWLFQMRADFTGSLQTGLNFRTKGGPLSINKGNVDIDLRSLVLNGDQELISDGRLEGDIEFLPFVPRENKGMKIMKFLKVDTQIRTETASLAFLNFYLANFNGMKVGGAGTLQGKLHLQEGKILDDTDITVAARELTLDWFDFHVRGDGNISIEAVDQEESTDVSVTFTNLDAFGENRDIKLFSGDGLTVQAQSNRFILLENENPFNTKRLAVAIPAVEVPDLSVYQLYLPDKLPVTLHGGTGNLRGNVELTDNSSLNGSIQLSSDAADIGINEFRFISNLDTALHVDSPALNSGIDMSGTYVHLHGAKLSDESGESSEPWHARVDIENGKLKLALPESMVNDDGLFEIYKGLKGKDISNLLETDNEDLQISGSISDLSWLNVLLANRAGLAITGSGEVSANIILKNGWPAPGTKIAIQPGLLGVEVLDYIAEGDGEVLLQIKKGGENPDAFLRIALEDGVMGRKNEKKAYIEEVEILLEAMARGISFDGKGRDMDLHLQIPSATVRDMAVYNLYLPEQAPIELTGGTAKISADVKLTPDTAKGRVRLQTNGLSARVDEQEVEGEVTTNITLVDGVPENMDFDISGSTITLDKVKVAGTEKNHNDEDWSARFELKKARAVWRPPVAMQIEADLQMTNSKPIVSVIANQRGKHGWLEKALTIDGVNGNAVMQMANNRIVLPYAYASSDKIDIGVKGVITPEERDGVFYVRFRKLNGILKVRDGERNLDVLNARDKFEEYDSENVSLRIGKTSLTDGDDKEVGN